MKNIRQKKIHTPISDANAVDLDVYACHMSLLCTPFFLFPSLVFAFQAFDDETLGMDTGGGKRRALEGGAVALEPPKRARKAAATAKKAEVKPKRTPPPPSSSDKKPPPAKRTKKAAAR